MSRNALALLSLAGRVLQVNTLCRPERSRATSAALPLPPASTERAQFCHILRLRSLPPEATWRPSGLQSTA